MKKFIILLIVFVCIWIMYQFPHSALSPGELSEGHQKLNNTCMDCHAPFRGISNEKCIHCHKLEDIGRDTTLNDSQTMPEENILFHQHLSDKRCTSCHSDHMGLKPEKLIRSFSHEILSPADLNKCTSCHSQPSDTLHKQLSTDCKSCHNPTGWKSSVTFDHELIQTPWKSNCISCHKNPDDSFHRSLKENCDKCHSTSQWKPSTFDHSNYFILDKDHNVECNTCHSNNNFKAYTCYGCHEHSESKIRDEHLEEGISNFTDCARCHRSADEHDIRMNGYDQPTLNQGDINTIKDHIKTQEKKKKKKDKKDDDD